MTMIRYIYPLKLRQWAFYRISKGRPANGPYPLQFAPKIELSEIVHTDIVGRSIAFTGFYELELSAEIRRRAKVGGLLVDVGANIGYFTHLWMNRADNQVICFEASPRVFPILSRNVADHPEWNGRVTLHELAASDRADTLRFDVGPPDQTGWGGIVGDQNTSEVVEVTAVRLDEMIAKNRQIAFLKIDVEGADPLVIIGAEGLFRRKQIAAGCFEINTIRMEQLGLSADPAIKLLHDCNYMTDVRDGECWFTL